MPAMMLEETKECEPYQMVALVEVFIIPAIIPF